MATRLATPRLGHGRRRWLLPGLMALVALEAAAACWQGGGVPSNGVGTQNQRFPPDAVVVDLAEGADVRVLQPGGLNIGPDATESLAPGELLALGVHLVAPHASGPDQLPNARVLWIHRSAMPAMSAAAVQARLSQGVAIGILDGSADEFQQAFGLRVDNASLLHAGTGRPVFVLVQTYQCPGNVTGASIQSDWLTRSAFIAASLAATIDHCTSTPETVPPDWST